MSQSGRFRIDRFLRCCPEGVFRAASEARFRKRWLFDLPGVTVCDYALDFREGGEERAVFHFDGGPVFFSHTRFRRIVPLERIVCQRRLRVGEVDVSTATRMLWLRPLKDGTLVSYEEQAVLHDATDSLTRQHDMAVYLMDRLGTIAAEASTPGGVAAP